MSEITEEDRHNVGDFVCGCGGCIATRARVAGLNMSEIDRDIVEAAMALNKAWEVPRIPTETELARLHYACVRRDLAIEVGMLPIRARDQLKELRP